MLKNIRDMSKYKDDQGYTQILRSHHKFSHKGYIREHRYRMELMLGRYLTRNEEVHYIDGNKENNNESNLMLFDSHSEHIRYENNIIRNNLNRICLLCKSTKTYFLKKRNHFVWKKFKDGFMCRNCYQKQYYGNKRFR